MKDAPKGVIPHIVIAGRRNAGKSSLVNALCGQEVAIVSSLPGTTTDPVEKKMEMAPLGPVLLIDTAGLDDEGDAGRLRIRRSREMLTRADLVILMVDGAEWGETEEELLRQTREDKMPCVIAVNIKHRPDNVIPDLKDMARRLGLPVVAVSPFAPGGVEELKHEAVRLLMEEAEESTKIFGDLFLDDGPILLLAPLDSGAPRGRLILPQVQTIRECLDENRACIVMTENLLDSYDSFFSRPPALVICDSQIVQLACQKLPPDIPLTTFSILMARLKGDLKQFALGAQKLSSLVPGDRVLLMEACSHHPQADDIGRVKIPALLKKLAGGELEIGFHAGRNMPEDVSKWDLVVHCGGCMLTPRQMKNRQKWASDRGIPMTNYGMAISRAQGVLERSMGIFPELLQAIRDTS